MERLELPERRRIHQPSVSPQPVETTLHTQRRIWPEVSLEDFAVVADRAYDPQRPLCVETECVGNPWFEAEESPNPGVCALFELRDAGRGDSQLLRLHRGVEDPGDQRE